MRRSLIVALIALFIAAEVMAQAAPPANGDSTPLPTIVKQTRLVYVPVVVEGKNGEAVSGLRKEQFTIEQDGHAQSIAFFEEVTQSVGFQDRAPAIAPGLVENFALSDAQARRTLIIILDTLNTPFLVQDTAKKALLKFLKTSLAPDQPVALMVLSSNGLHQVHSITSDPKLLMEIVNRVESHYNRNGNTLDTLAMKETLPNGFDVNSRSATLTTDLASRASMIERYMDDVESGFQQRRAAETTLIALEQLAGCFTGIPGRKSVIWATGGFPFEPIDPHSFTGTDTSLMSSYYRAWNRLNDANISIYPVDVNGLEYVDPVPLIARGGENRMFGAGLGGRNPNAPPFDSHAQQQSTLRAFASATGGRAFLNSNDIAGSFAKASQEAGRYYLLAYYLRAGSDKPGWHKLKVRADVQHVDVRAREGFFVTEGTQKEKDRIKELSIALGAPADYTGVHFGIRLTPDASNATAKPSDRRKANIHVSFPPGALEIDTQHGNQVGTEFLVLALEKDKTRGQRTGSFQVKLTPEQMEKVNRVGIGFDEVLEVPTGKYEIRAAIRDVNSGKVGTVTTFLDVR